MGLQSLSITSYLSPKCQARRSAIGGLGIFAEKEIVKDEIIAIWGGKIYSQEDLEQLSVFNPSLLIHPLSIAEGFYMGPTDPSRPPEPSDYFNHSCEPNAGVKGQIILVARTLIVPDEEICFDYETTENQSSIGMGFTCHCGHSSCKHEINGIRWNKVDFHKKNREYISWYLQKKFDSLTK